VGKEPLSWEGEDEGDDECLTRAVEETLNKDDRLVRWRSGEVALPTCASIVCQSLVENAARTSAITQTTTPIRITGFPNACQRHVSFPFREKANLVTAKKKEEISEISAD
jgi:hypothetical protein